MAMDPRATAGNPYATDAIIEQDLIEPDGEMSHVHGDGDMRSTVADPGWTWSLSQMTMLMILCKSPPIANH